MTLLTALLLITAALADLFSRIGVLDIPEQYVMYPAYVVLFVGMCLLIQGIHQIIQAHNNAIARENRITAKENYDNQMNQILEDQRQQNLNEKQTVNTGEVVYDDDAI